VRATAHALEQLVPLVYRDLQQLARRQLRGTHLPTLNTTSLVHEAYLKLAGADAPGWEHRGHFFAVASMAMRQIVVDYARHSHAQKRGGAAPIERLDAEQIAVEAQAEALIELDEALRRLNALDERLPRIVECRFFTGLTAEETAEALGVSLRTVERDWKRARAWLREELAAMDAERRARADAVFTEALDLEASAREACVRERCGEDHELADLVLRLLADAESDDDAFLSPGRLLEGPLWQRASAALESGGIGPGSSVGAWTVVRELGAGGMATVYLVRRREAEFSQQAALKLIKRGIDTDEVAHRFRQERQILASLDHPNVARLLDGGVSEDGRPYFVMEYVDGPPVDRWCEEQRATIEKRLALFLDVARAVEQAHRRLVVHRDLKPGNVLVDPRGDVKLLDFGIAKLLDPLAAAEAPATRTAVRVMTPEYASPEQVRGEPVTTASDVYQLGLLLYELLTRRRAHQVEGGSLTDIERVVCRQIPVPPGAIVGKLRGDLDTIVMKALAKEPDARYASVTALIEDVTRHLEGLPVKARRPTVAYRVHRFVRRHALAVAAAAVVLVSLVAGLSATLWQARVAARERDNARREAATAGRVSEFLIETFEIADPGEARGNTVTAREVLDSGTRRIGLLDDEPEIQSTMKDVMGRVYQSLGLYDPAHTLLTESLTMRRAASSTPDPRVADSLDHVGMLWIAKGKYDEAEKSLHEGLAMRRALFGESHGSVADSLQHLAQLEHLRDHLEEAGKAARPGARHPSERRSA
jgi:serine/threonine-protein kinase